MCAGADLTSNVLRVSLNPEALTALALEDAEIEATIEAPAGDVARFREVLAQILAYGRADALPTHVTICPVTPHKCLCHGRSSRTPSTTRTGTPSSPRRSGPRPSRPTSRP